MFDIPCLVLSSLQEIKLAYAAKSLSSLCTSPSIQGYRAAESLPCCQIKDSSAESRNITKTAQPALLRCALGAVDVKKTKVALSEKNRRFASC